MLNDELSLFAPDDRFIVATLGSVDGMRVHRGEYRAVTDRPLEQDRLLKPQEVAALFRVDPKTVTRWAKAGKLTCIRTLGGHRRYRESEVRALLMSGVFTPNT